MQCGILQPHRIVQSSPYFGFDLLLPVLSSAFFKDQSKSNCSDSETAKQDTQRSFIASLIRFGTDTIGKFDLFDGCICHCGHCSVAYVCDSDLNCIDLLVIDDIALLVIDFRDTVDVNFLLLTLEVFKLVCDLVKCEVSVCIILGLHDVLAALIRKHECELAVLQVFALKDLDSAKFDRCLDIELLICEYQLSAVVDLLSHLKCS